MVEIKKRDGCLVEFDKEKIIYAIYRAARSVGENNREEAVRLGELVVDLMPKDGSLSVENVQDLVEKVLVENKNYKIAKAYILYRNQHEQIRFTKNLMSNNDIVQDYIDSSDWRVKENANMGYSLQGLNFHISSLVSKDYWLHQIYTPEIRKSHEEGRLHIHDLGTISVYCVGWDLEDLIKTGFKGVPGKVASKPAKHFRTILGHIINFFYTLQGESAGAQAFSNFDTLLAPFIKYDGLEYEEVKQAMQEFIFNINVPTRVGFQTPFTNITMDLKVPGFMEHMPVYIGGEPKDRTYGEFQEEMDMLNKAFAEVMSEGDANGRVFTFPIPTYNITKDFDWDNENLKPLWDMTARYGIPYFSNFINSSMSPDDVRSMCCRLRLDKRELQARGGGLFGSNPLTGSIGVVTINLPRLGYESKTKEELFQRLDKLMEIAKSSLQTKRKVLERLTEQKMFPYAMFYLRNIKKRYGEYWKNHFSTIGLVGMSECLENFLGCDITTDKGNEFALEILDFMRDKLAKFQEETDSIYNLEATPAEGTAHRLARIDRKDYPDIIVANNESVSSNDPYYTNSSQLPVNHTDDLFEALKLQDELQTKYTGGTVFHIFVGEKQIPVESIKQLVKKVATNFKLPYFTLSPTFSICDEHGYIYGEHKACPKCKAKGVVRECEVYSRIVGYLRPVNQWNGGKRAEYEKRKLLDTKIIAEYPEVRV